MSDYFLSIGWACGGSIGVDNDVEQLEDGEQVLAIGGRRVPIKISGEEVFVYHNKVEGPPRSVRVRPVDRYAEELYGAVTAIRPEDIRSEAGLVLTVFGEPFGVQQITPILELRYRGEKAEQ